MHRRFGPFLSVWAFFLAAPGIGHAQVATEIAQGKRLFLRCASCHAATASAPGRIGPSLKDVFGRKVGTLPGYTYSAAMRSSDFHWDYSHLDKWLTHPDAVVPGTTMAFAGVPERAERNALIAYLKSLGE